MDLLAKNKDMMGVQSGHFMGSLFNELLLVLGCKKHPEAMTDRKNEAALKTAGELLD